MILIRWAQFFCQSSHARFACTDWPIDLDMKIIWDTCLSPKFLLAIIESSEETHIKIKQGPNFDNVLSDPSLYKPHFVGLEFILLLDNNMEKGKAIRTLKSMCVDMDEVRACKFIRQRVNYPLEGVE